MKDDYTFEKELSELRSVSSFVARDQMTHLYETVNEDKDDIITTALKEIDDKVIRDTLPRGIRNKNWGQFTDILVSR